MSERQAQGAAKRQSSLRQEAPKKSEALQERKQEWGPQMSWRRSFLSLPGALLTLGLLFTGQVSAAEEFDQYALKSVSTSLSTSQAGAHPDFTTSCELTENAGETRPYALTRDILVELLPDKEPTPLT